MNVIVSYRDGFPVRLKQIATVINSIEDDKNVGWYNETRGIVLAIQRQPGANTVQVIDRIRELLPTFKAQLPGGVNLDILYDRSKSIRESLHDVQFTLVLALALVVLVIFFFLRNVRATLIPSVAIPLSIVGTFGVMYLLGFSVNNFSLMALTLRVGFVVDDAIVVLENIVRHMEKGETPIEAAFNGSTRDRLHHPFDDPLAGGGLHSGALHGRHAGPAAERIRRHHRGGHSHLRDSFRSRSRPCSAAASSRPRTAQA